MSGASTLVRHDADVIIVGAGPGGLALGVGLNRHGRKAIILEAAPGTPFTPRGEFLQPNGASVLDRLGVLDDLKAQDVHVNRFVHVYRPGGEHLGDADYGLLEPPYNYVLIHMPNLLRQVLQSRLGETEILWQTRFQHLRRVGGVWEVTTLTPTGERVLRAPIVVGADGVRSPVRDALGIRAAVRPYADAYALNVIPRPRSFTGDARQYQGDGMLLGMLPVSSDKLYLYWYVPAKKVDEFRTLPPDRFYRRLSAVAPDVGPELRFPAPGQWLILRPFRVVAETWVAEGAALIGDAAHALNPNAGQGTNQALQDACALADILADRLRSGRLGRDDLRPYEQERRPAATLAQRVGEVNAFLWTSANPLVTWVQQRAQRRLARHPEIHRRLIAQAAGLSAQPLSPLDGVRLLL